jgi:hypothetical protein
MDKQHMYSGAAFRNIKTNFGNISVVRTENKKAVGTPVRPCIEATNEYVMSYSMKHR